MDKLLRKMYRNYGQYVNHFRSFPLNLDGLKPVERRVLLAAYQVARDKFVKSARVDGYTLGNYHPHASAYGTIVRMVNNGFLDGQGNFGTNEGADPSPPAAFRYTECKLSKSTFKLAFKLINYIDFVESELDDEPQYLPTMFPFCLMGNSDTTGIGFGYRSYIPSYHIKDLYQRLLWLLKKVDKKPTIKPVTKCKILSDNNILEELLTTGKAKLKIQGILKTSPQKCKVILKTWPPGISFNPTILNRNSKFLENQDVAWIDQTSEEVNILWEVTKQRNRDKIFEKFYENLLNSVTTNVSYECNIVDLNRNVRVISIDEMLLNTYEMFTKVNDKMLNIEIGKIRKLKIEHENLEKIRPVLSEELKNKNYDVKTTINNISNKCNIDENIIKELFSKYNINKLLTLNTDTTSLKNKENELLTKLNNIETFVLDQYKDII